MTLTIPDTAEVVVRASHVPGPPQGRWSYADYCALPDLAGYRYEILAGVLYMAPAPIPEHENIAAIVAARLVTAVEDTGLGRVFTSPDIDAGGSVVRPDAVVVLAANAGIVAERRLVGPPDLVVEISSPSTAAYDRDAVSGKRAAYARMGVPEYWIIDPASRSITLLVLQGTAYAERGTYAGEDMLPSEALPMLNTPAGKFFPR
ncbi:MAG: Uma2 family endonuclease [Chloroflexi bacterium]|nr:Uma2 family endonuclease [Chloroflexota bacterium]